MRLSRPRKTGLAETGDLAAGAGDDEKLDDGEAAAGRDGMAGGAAGPAFSKTYVAGT